MTKIGQQVSLYSLKEFAFQYLQIIFIIYHKHVQLKHKFYFSTQK